MTLQLSSSVYSTRGSIENGLPKKRRRLAHRSMESRGGRLGAAAELTGALADFAPSRGRSLKRAAVAPEKLGLRDLPLCSCRSPCPQGACRLPGCGSALENCIPHPLAGLPGPLLSSGCLLRRKPPSLEENLTVSVAYVSSKGSQELKKRRVSGSQQFSKNVSTPYSDHR